MNAIATFLSGFGVRRVMLSIAVLALALFSPSHAAAAGRPSVVVLPASGHGVSAQIIERARRMFVESLGRPNRFRVTDFDRPPTGIGPRADQAILIARMAAVQVAIAFDLSHEGADAIFDVACWDAASGETRCHVREKTAAGPELLPDFTEWLATRVTSALDGSTETLPHGGDGFVAERPRHEPRAFTFGARASVTIPIDSPARSSAPLGGLGVLMAVDTGSLLVAVGLDFQSGAADRRSWGAGIDLALPLADGERLPYLGAGAWFIEQHLGGQGQSGLQLRPALGILWGRHDLAHLRTEASYFVDLFEEREPDRLIQGSGQGHVSHGLTLSLGATF